VDSCGPENPSAGGAQRPRPVRRFGRELQERVRARKSEFLHLLGRTVTLAKLADQPMPGDHEQLLNELEAVLAEYKGIVGENLDLSHGLPSQPAPAAPPFRT
jgi:hypothetical protein